MSAISQFCLGSVHPKGQRKMEYQSTIIEDISNDKDSGLLQGQNQEAELPIIKMHLLEIGWWPTVK